MWPFSLLRSDSDEDDGELVELQKIEWTETVERTRTNITETFVWPGGAEKTITYTKEESPMMNEFYLASGDSVNHVVTVESAPAYTVREGEETVTYERERTRTAWVTDVPPEAEPTGETREGRLR